MGDRIERDLLRGSLDMLVLSVLAEKPLYGYLIQKRLRFRSGEKVKLPAGTMYPLLHRLEASKLIKSKWDDSTGRRRKWYELTVKGRKQLKSQVEQWRSYAECISGLIDDLSIA